jgi:YVTN family beta-propeller protein
MSRPRATVSAERVSGLFEALGALSLCLALAIVLEKSGTGTAGAVSRDIKMRVVKRIAIAYVTGDASPGTVTPINTAKNVARRRISVGADPTGVAITPNGKTAYVTNDTNPGTVTPVDLATKKAEKAIPVGPDPVGIAISPDGTTAYVVTQATSTTPGTVTPIDLATDTPGPPIKVSDTSSFASIAITPNGDTVYATDTGDGTVVPIDTATNTAGTPIPIPGTPPGPGAIAITPNGSTIWVTDGITPAVTSIDTTTNTVATTIGIPTTEQTEFGAATVVPGGIAITPNSETAYVADTEWFTPAPSPNLTPGTSVTPIDLVTNTAESPIQTSGDEPINLAVTPDGGTAYVTNEESGFVTAIDTATNTAKPFITAPPSYGIAIGRRIS